MMFISTRHGFHPLRGLIGSSLCFLVVFITLLLLETAIYFFIVITHFDAQQLEGGIVYNALKRWFLPNIGAATFVACTGWLAFSTRSEYENGVIQSIVWLFLTSVFISIVMDNLKWNPFPPSTTKSNPLPSLIVDLLRTTIYPLLATFFLTLAVLAKIFWHKDRTAIDTSDRSNDPPGN